MKERQGKILKYIIKEYIKTAQPVSSKTLSGKTGISLSSATLRIDMMDLIEQGYLSQPHISAGRVPTEKAYQWFIQKFCESDLSPKVEKQFEEISLKKREEETIKELSKLIALISKNISILLFRKEIFWQGLSYFLSQPEFYEPDEILEMAEIFEEVLSHFAETEFMAEELQQDEVKVFIGKENPFGRNKNLSLILGGAGKQGLIGILGPERMDYTRNIALIRRAKELVEEF